MPEKVEVSLDKSKLYPLLLVDIAKKLEGTTRLHKMMFILKQEYNVPISQRFIKYHYGPFSSELRDDINFFVENELIEQTVVALGVDADGYPMLRTTYTISRKGKETVEKCFSSKETEAFQKVVERWNAKPLTEVIKHAKSLQQ